MLKNLILISPPLDIWHIPEQTNKMSPAGKRTIFFLELIRQIDKEKKNFQFQSMDRQKSHFSYIDALKPLY